MDFLNKAYGQLADLFRSMTPGARITTGLLLAVIVGSLVFLFRQQSDRTDEYLFGGEVLSQSQITAIEAAFAKAKLETWDVQGQRVRVPRGKKHLYWEAIAAAGAFPETPDTAWDKMFVNDNLLKTKQTRQLETQRTLDRSLALTIQEMAWIDVARVQIQEMDSGSFPHRPEKRALVSVKTKGNERLDARRVETIRNMVAYGGGVKSQNVTVADLSTGQAYPGTGREGAFADNLYVKHKREFEDDMEAKIADRLSVYPGLKIAVHAELDQEMVNQTVTSKYDPKPTAIQVENISKETTASRPDRGGRPGVVPNAGIGNVPQQVSTAAGPESSTTETRENQRSVVGTTQTVTEKAPFVPTWMSVSIGIPRSYFEQVWRERNPSAPGEAAKPSNPAEVKAIETEIVADIEKSVNTLLPKVAQGEDPYPRVAVVPYTETPLPTPASPGLAESAMSWLGSNWQTLGLFLLAAGSVIFLRGMIRSVPSRPAPAAEAPAGPRLAATEATEEDVEEQLEAVNSLRSRFQGSERSLKEELTELVREDLDAAASVLQNWIGEAV